MLAARVAARPNGARALCAALRLSDPPPFVRLSCTATDWLSVPVLLLLALSIDSPTRRSLFCTAAVPPWPHPQPHPQPLAQPQPALWIRSSLLAEASFSAALCLRCPSI